MKTTTLKVKIENILATGAIILAGADPHSERQIFNKATGKKATEKEMKEFNKKNSIIDPDEKRKPEMFRDHFEDKQVQVNDRVSLTIYPKDKEAATKFNIGDTFTLTLSN